MTIPLLAAAALACDELATTTVSNMLLCLGGWRIPEEGKKNKDGRALVRKGTELYKTPTRCRTPR